MPEKAKAPERERLASRLGFILLSAACAIGIGNVWRFPYVAGKCGGGWFVLFYLVSLLALGIPVLMMEFACGRAAQRSIAKLHSVLTPSKPAWGVHGALGSAGLFILMMFYTVVTGWMALYFLKAAGGAFQRASDFETLFGAALAAPGAMTAATLVVIWAAVVVCAIGLKNGLERVNKWMMLALLALIAVLAFRSLTLDGAAEGAKFYLVPDWSRVREAGVMTVIVEAMNQAFFTLSLGIGSMAIFGSYIGKDHSLLKESLYVAALDTLVALAAGLIVIPACFAFHVAPGKGPGLVFVTLPQVFRGMTLGRVWGTLFFLFMTFAAFSTVLAVFEGIIASIRDYTGWGRRKASLALGAAISVMALPAILGYNAWSAFHPLGGGSTILDFEDFVVSNILLPLGGLAFALYSAHGFGWGWDAFARECDSGRGVKVPRFARGYCRWVLPALIVALVALGLVDRFVVKIFQ